MYPTFPFASKLVGKRLCQIQCHSVHILLWVYTLIKYMYQFNPCVGNCVPEILNNKYLVQCKIHISIWSKTKHNKLSLSVYDCSVNKLTLKPPEHSLVIKHWIHCYKVLIVGTIWYFEDSYAHTYTFFNTAFNIRRNHVLVHKTEKRVSSVFIDIFHIFK